METGKNEIELIKMFYAVLIYHKNQEVFIWQKRLET
jgi:hypothetical protein